jgi:hypothetical protein
MLYPKNVPNIERMLRIVMGIVMVGVALLGNVSLPIAGLLIASAAFVAITGFVGWCPACAMVGRKIKQSQSKS